MKPALLLLTLLLTACTSKSERPTVRIAYVGTGLQTWCLPIALARSLEYYKQEGLDVTLESVPSGGKALQALMGGSVDAAGVGFAHAVEMVAQGQQIRSFFVMGTLDTRVLVVSRMAAARIHSIADLKGASVGVTSPGSVSHTFLNYHLLAHHLRLSDVSVVGIGAGPSAIMAVELGKVDAAVVMGGDHLRLLHRNSSIPILLDGSTPQGMRATYGVDSVATGTLSSTRAWLDKNPDTARRLARALQRTHQWMATHTAEELHARLPESFRSADAATDLEILRWSAREYTPGGKMPAGAPEAVKHMLEATNDKVRNAKIDLASTWTNDFLPEPK